MIGAGFVAAPIACSPPPVSEGGFDSIQPAAKLYAIHAAGSTGDRSAVPRLIEQLDSDDPAVRMFAIEALERLTGQRLGYRAYDPPHRRAVSTERWRQWHRSGGGASSEPAGGGKMDRAGVSGGR